MSEMGHVSAKKVCNESHCKVRIAASHWDTQMTQVSTADGLSNGSEYHETSKYVGNAKSEPVAVS